MSTPLICLVLDAIIYYKGVRVAIRFVGNFIINNYGPEIDT